MNRFQKFAYAAIALSQPGLPVGGQPVTLSEIQDRITQIAQFLIVISMVVAVGFIVWGGLRWITARGDPAVVKTAQATIWNGIIGAAVILAVGVILQTVAGLVTRTFFS